MIVYMATNKINKKVYIGKTTQDFIYRIRVHIADAMAGRGFIFHRALRKYGFDNFDWQVIDEAETEQELNEKEKYWIRFYEAFDPTRGYNLTYGGDGGLVVDEVKKRISRTHTGVPFSDDRKKKISAALKGRTITPEWRARLSSAMKGKSPWNKGIPHSDETRQKISMAKKGKPLRKGEGHARAEG